MPLRRLLIALFALGTVGGYGSAIAGASCHARARSAAFERHVASLCAQRAAAGASARQAPPDDGDDLSR